MIIENKTTENGDVLRISTDVPVLGLVALSGFMDDTDGETSDVYFKKKFRYSKDIGVTWSEWQDLNQGNIQSVPISEKESFLFEYAYQQEGENGELYFNWVQLEGEVKQGDDVIYSKTDFKKFFDVNDINVLGWAFNVLEKLYERGILPKYVQRDYTENSKDFIDYWLSITHFFAIIVYMARQFQDIPKNKILFDLFLESKGLALSSEESLVQREYLFANYIDEFRKRGTKNITSTGGTVNGEFMRLINYKDADEFMFFNLVFQDLGWCCDLSSPMWTGTEQIVNAMKAYEYGEDVKDKSLYPLSGDVDNITIVEEDGKSYFSLPSTAGFNGIEAPGEKEKLLKISPSLSYEIYFKVKASGNASSPDHVVFGVNGYNENLEPVDFYNGQTGEVLNSFFDKDTPLSLKKTGTEYWFRGVITRADTITKPNVHLNFENGVPLISDRSIKYFTPVIGQRYSTGDKTILIRDIKVKPLDLPIERGYLGSILPIVAYFYNNSGKEQDYIKNFTEQYLLGYKNNIILPTYLTGIDLTRYTLTVEWIPTVGGIVTGAGTYREGDIATVRITPSVGYQIDSVTIDGEQKTVSNQYLLSMDSNREVSVVFTQSLMNFVSSSRKVSFEGTIYEGDLVIDWGDGVETKNQLTYNYSDNLPTHVIMINSGNIKTLKGNNNGISVVNIFNMPGITSMNLDDNDLTTIDLSTLTGLTTLSIARNKLTTISLTSSPLISTLNLEGNDLVSLSVSNLLSLETLKADKNKLTSLDVSANVNLVSLVAGENNISSLSLGTAHKLAYVDVNTNNLTDFTIPSANVLSFLNVSSNSMINPVFDGGNYPELTTLYIDSMPVMKTLEVTNTPNLLAFHANENPVVTDATITRNSFIMAINMQDCPNLVNADYSDNQRASSVNVKNDDSLKTLKTDNTPLSEIDLTTNSSLTVLSMNNNKFTNFSAPYCTRLEKLSMTGNELETLTLTNNTLLTDITVNDNKLIVLDLSVQKSLRNLNCSSNLLTNVSGSTFTSSDYITTILASNNKFTEFIITGKNLLKTVDLSDCNVLKTVTVTGNAVFENLDLSNDAALITLDGYDNALKTVDISSSSKLRYVYLQNNQISSINYDNCEAIVNMNLSKNLLTTFNPNAIGGSLKGLYISENQLTTLDFTSTTSLQILDCDNNALTSLTFNPSTDTPTSIEEVVNRLSAAPQLAYALDGNTTKMSRSALTFDTFVAVDNYEDGFIKGTKALKMTDSYATFPSEMVGDGVTAISGSFMIYPLDNTSYNGLCGGVMFGSNTGQFGWALGWGGNSFGNKLNINIYTAGGRLAFQAKQLAVNKWQHVMFRLHYASDASWHVELYVDGVKYETTGTPIGVTGDQTQLSFSGLSKAPHNGDFHFGRAYQTGWRQFNGYAQDVVITNSYFSDNDVNLFDTFYKNAGVSRFSSLTKVDCSYNQLTTLDVSKADYITDLNCSHNNIGVNSQYEQSSLIFGSTLESNKITDLDASFNSLKYLDFTRNTNLVNVTVNDNTSLNKIESITVTSGMSSVKNMIAFNTGLIKLKISTYSGLKKLDLHDCPAFISFVSFTYTNTLEYLDLSNCVSFSSSSEFIDLNNNVIDNAKELYLKGLTRLNVALNVSKMTSLQRLDTSGSAFNSIKTRDTDLGVAATNLEWWSSKNCANLKSAQLIDVDKLKYMNFASSGITSIDVASSESKVYEEIHVEHTPIIKNSLSIPYIAFFGLLNQTTSGKYYTSNDDYFLKQDTYKNQVERKGWTVIFVD